MKGKMSGENKNIEVLPVANPHMELLKTKYFCRVDNGKKVNVVVELTADDKTKKTQIPQRYVLMIDVSGSMGFTIQKGDPRSLLDRMKVFANLLVDNTTEDTWVSIVTFSNDAKIVLPMTRMNKIGKNKAYQIIAALATIGGTNISEGLFTSLDATRSVNGKTSKDCIVLFTDGAANDGIVEPNELISEFRRRMQQLGRNNIVQLAAITIGSYSPYLLAEISRHLSSDAFLWLNLEYDFEADMLVPMFLREMTNLTDISLEFRCLEGVKFLDDNYVPQSLQANCGNDEKTHFIHILPKGIIKHIKFVLELPEKSSELDNSKILEIKKRFLDHNLTEHHSTDFLELHLQSLLQTRAESSPSSKPHPDAMDFLETRSAYLMQMTVPQTSWDCAQQALVEVFHDECRNITISALDKTKTLIECNETANAKKCFREAIDLIEKVKNTANTVLGGSNTCYISLQKNLVDLTSTLQHGSKEIRNINWAQLTAMQSSICTEMPNATGVFDPKRNQPYMPDYVRNRLNINAKIARRRGAATKAQAKLLPAVRVFTAQNLVLSESLVGKKVGKRQETLQELIIKCGGRSVPHVGTYHQNTVLICSYKDYKRKSGKVREATNSKTPIVKESFIHDCIKEKRIVDLDYHKW